MTDELTGTGYLDCIREALAPFAGMSRGNPCAQVACLTVRGLPADEQADEALSKAIVAMGYADEGCFYLDATADPEQLALCLETLDPLIVIALEAGCSKAVGRLMGERPPEVGECVQCKGRGYVILEDFTASLCDPDAKRRSWSQMRKLARADLFLR